MGIILRQVARGVLATQRYSATPNIQRGDAIDHAQFGDPTPFLKLKRRTVRNEQIDAVAQDTWQTTQNP
jgi:hypothetical protein